MFSDFSVILTFSSFLILLLLIAGELLRRSAVSEIVLRMLVATRLKFEIIQNWIIVMVC